MAVDKIEDAPVMIVAACVLHNICLINDDDDIEDLMDNNSNDMIMIMTITTMEMLKIRGTKS